MLKKHGENTEAKPIDLGDALRKGREYLGVTMQAVANAAGLSVGFISQVERGITSPSLSSLASLAEVLKTEINSFLQAQPTPDQTTHKISCLAYSVAGADVSYEHLSSTFPESQLHSVIVHEPPGHRIEPISHRLPRRDVQHAS